jgi:hypothetical protein
MIYIGYDAKENEDQYTDYLVMHYKPKMRPSFGNKLVIDVPTAGEARMVK